MAHADLHDSSPVISSFADDPDMQDLVVLFVDEMPARMEDIRGAFDERDMTSLTRISHQLKGAAPGYGFDAVGSVAADLERTLHQVSDLSDDLERIEEGVSRLLSICGRIAKAA